MHTTIRAKEVSCTFILLPAHSSVASLLYERLLKEYTNLTKEDLARLFEHLSAGGFLLLSRSHNDPLEFLMRWKVVYLVVRSQFRKDPRFIPNLCPYDPAPKSLVYELVQNAQMGVESKDRTHHLKTYKNCFLGKKRHYH